MDLLARWATVTPAQRPAEEAGNQASDSDQRIARRNLFRFGALAALAGPLVGPALAGCGPAAAPPAPDALLPLLTAARRDAASATAASTAFPGDAPTFSRVATVRNQHATALLQEITRAGGAGLTTGSSAAPAATTPATGAPASEGAALTQLATGLRDAQQQAAGMVPTAPRYRAGLVGSVSAGCASLLEALGR